MWIYATTRQIEALAFVGICIQSGSVCFLYQMEIYLANVHKSV